MDVIKEFKKTNLNRFVFRTFSCSCFDIIKCFHILWIADFLFKFEFRKYSCQCFRLMKTLMILLYYCWSMNLDSKGKDLFQLDLLPLYFALFLWNEFWVFYFVLMKRKSHVWPTTFEYMKIHHNTSIKKRISIDNFFSFKAVHVLIYTVSFGRCDRLRSQSKFVL